MYLFLKINKTRNIERNVTLDMQDAICGMLNKIKLLNDVHDCVMDEVVG